MSSQSQTRRLPPASKDPFGSHLQRGPSATAVRSLWNVLEILVWEFLGGKKLHKIPKTRKKKSKTVHPRPAGGGYPPPGPRGMGGGGVA